MPHDIISTLQKQRQQDRRCEEDEIVMLVTPNVQEQDEEYVRYKKGKYMELWLDAYMVPHETGVEINKAGKVALQVETWRAKAGERIRGPADAVFPHREGWVVYAPWAWLPMVQCIVDLRVYIRFHSLCPHGP